MVAGLESATEESYRSTIGTISRLLCVPEGTALADSRSDRRSQEQTPLRDVARGHHTPR